MNVTEALDGRGPLPPITTTRALARTLGFEEGSSFKDTYTQSTNYFKPFALEQAVGDHYLFVDQNRMGRHHPPITFIGLDFKLKTPMQWGENIVRYKPLEKDQIIPDVLEWMKIDIDSILRGENWRARIAQLVEVYKLGESFIQHVLLPEVSKHLPDFQYHDNQFSINKNVHIYNNDGRVYTFILDDNNICVTHSSALFEPDTDHPVTLDGESVDIAEHSYGSPRPQLWETKRAWENGIDTCIEGITEDIHYFSA